MRRRFQHLTRAAAVCGAAALIVPLLNGPAQAVEPMRAPEVASSNTWTGEISSSFGSAMAHGSCDVNGDGYQDAVVGSWLWDKAPYKDFGGGYVIWGKPDQAGGSVEDPSAAGATRIDGPAGNSRVAFQLGCAGDTNGDGSDDIIMTDYINNQAWIVFGDKNFTEVKWVPSETADM